MTTGTKTRIPTATKTVTVLSRYKHPERRTLLNPLATLQNIIVHSTLPLKCLKTVLRTVTFVLRNCFTGLKCHKSQIVQEDEAVFIKALVTHMQWLLSTALFFLFSYGSPHLGSQSITRHIKYHGSGCLNLKISQVVQTHERD